MIQLIKKSEQFNDAIFNGKLVVNKPVYNGAGNNILPYSNLFYWSHSTATDDCEFGLHPHKGFEIMTFILEGNVSHYDTATNVWTPLEKGDFQIIQSNSGLQHRERITKGTRAFQIWFDPNFRNALLHKPAYVDYKSKDFEAKFKNGVDTITYIGNGGSALAVTPNLTISKLIFENKIKTTIDLDENSSYTFYVLNGKGSLNSSMLDENDAIRISNENVLEVDFEGELFVIETPSILDYQAVWA